MATTYLTIHQLAYHLGVSYHTVQKWKSRGYGPPVHTHLCRRALYLPTEVAVWQAAQVKA